MTTPGAPPSERKLDEEIEDSFPASDPPSTTAPTTSIGAPDVERQTFFPIAKKPEIAVGFTLSSEENSPSRLVELAKHAEAAGLDFVSISDHFHPWVTTQGHSPFVWATLGGIAASTDRIVVGTGVTCPTLRMHPAIVAHAAATAASMFKGRFYFGVGTGEALNEQVVGARWPSGEERMARLEEAIGIIRELWTGNAVTHDGQYFTVSDARLFTLPDDPPCILVAAGSPASAKLAAEQDGLISTTPDPEVFCAFEDAGGESKPRVGQVTVCWSPDEAEARATARRYWPTTVLDWDVLSNVPTPAMFEDITATATEEDVAKNILCGPSLEPILERIGEYADGGFDHIYVHQVGPLQDEFLGILGKEIAPEVKRRSKEK